VSHAGTSSIISNQVLFCTDVVASVTLASFDGVVRTVTCNMFSHPAERTRSSEPQSTYPPAYRLHPPKKPTQTQQPPLPPVY